MNITKVSKLFYGEYPYKITYKRLYGFPSGLFNMSLTGLKTPEEHNWWFDYPSTDDERQEIKSVYFNLQSVHRVYIKVKTRNSVF